MKILYKPGDRVRLIATVDRFPHTVVEIGATGTVVDRGSDSLGILLDEHDDGLDDWGNVLLFPRTVAGIQEFYESTAGEREGDRVTVPQLRAAAAAMAADFYASFDDVTEPLRFDQMHDYMDANDLIQDHVIPLFERVYGREWGDDPDFWAVANAAAGLVYEAARKLRRGSK